MSLFTKRFVTFLAVFCCMGVFFSSGLNLNAQTSNGTIAKVTRWFTSPVGRALGVYRPWKETRCTTGHDLGDGGSEKPRTTDQQIVCLLGDAWGLDRSLLPVVILP
jgi:hypothetical protein